MVKEPVVTTLAWALPLIVPISPLATIAILAGPPRALPVRAEAKSLMNSDAFVIFKKLAKRTNIKT
ncbi:hypothetical protein ES705_27791 [subsurface metagenome]